MPHQHSHDPFAPTPAEELEWQDSQLGARLDPAKLVRGDQGQARVLLVGVYTGAGHKEECEEHLEELERLCDTFGLLTLEKLPCPLRQIDAATYLGSGKIEEIRQLVVERKLDAVVFDEEILPSQQRNLERVLQRPVLDRTEVILGVFAQRAHSREARLQVELAQARYQFPRLRRLWTHLGRQSGSGGGGTYVKGEGEKQIEIDRRILRRRIERLEKQIAQVRQHRETQRQARERAGIPTFAIVGYTNAGKSTLLNALTQAGVFVEDKLFATLDTTTRKFTLPNHQEILLVDTVGFIRKLPHQLVAAFKSTLEEAVHADILVHLIDASSPVALEQAQATVEVLDELGAEDRPVITVLNKMDTAEDRAQIERLRLTFPRTVRISALTHEGFNDLMEAMEQQLSGLRKRMELRIPQADYALISSLRAHGQVLKEEYDENDVLITADVPKEMVHRFQPYSLVVEQEEKPHQAPVEKRQEADGPLPPWLR
jgi:GTP-binding protein HflX